MFPAELLPDFLFDQRELLLTYAYCLHFVGRNHTRVPFEGKIISLRPREVLIPISKWDLRLGIAPETFLHHLSELEQLDLVELTKEERYLLVQFTKINIPPVVDPRSRDVAEGAVQPITVNDFSDRYLEHVEKNLAKKSLENSQRVMKHFCLLYGRFMLGQLQALHLEQFKDARRQRVGATTVNMDIKTLKSCMEVAIAWGYLKVNPFRAVKHIRQDREPPAFMTKEDCHEVLAATTDDRLRALFAFLLLTGFRRGEAVFLKWSDIDFERGIITVRSSEAYRVKLGKSRSVPISPEVRSLLQGLERFDPYVFADQDGEKFKEDHVTKSFKAAARAAGLSDALKLHSTRATFATLMGDAGVSMHVIQKLLGHAYMRTTETYTQLPAESLRKAVGSVTLLGPLLERPETKAVHLAFSAPEAST